MDLKLRAQINQEARAWWAMLDQERAYTARLTAELAALRAENERLRATSDKWASATRNWLAAHDASLSRLGEEMVRKGLTSITVPGNFADELNAINALRELVDEADAARGGDGK